MSQEAYEKAMEELDGLEKSQKEEEPDTTLDDLSKALEAELEDELNKSKDEEEDEGAEPEAEDGDDGDEGDEDVEKSQDFEDDELVKASVAYEELTKSVQNSHASLHEEFETMRKSMAAHMNLSIKLAKVIANLAKSMPELEAVVKSIPGKEQIESINKSLEALGSQPAAPNKAVIGVGKESNSEMPMTKSVSEISDLLTKAVQAGKINSFYLSQFGTYKDATMLPPEVKTAIGI